MTTSVIDVDRKAIPLAAGILTQAFRDDPIFVHIFGTRQYYDQAAPRLFRTLVRWAALYGKAWATPGLEAVALRRLPGKYQMSVWSLVRAGMLTLPLNIPAARRLLSVTSRLAKKHKELMGEQPHWYCQTVAVAPEHQGKGLGRVLMQHTFALADAAGLPCYLEVAADKAITIHQRYGYVAQDLLLIPEAGLKVHLMIRPPRPL